MSVELNHTIVTTPDRWAGARWLTDVLGLPEPTASGPFAAVTLTNDVTLDFADGAPVPGEHYAFLIDDRRLDEVAARLAERGVSTWADPGHRTPGQNTRFGGRGFYFDSPDGYNLEVLTRDS